MTAPDEIIPAWQLVSVLAQLYLTIMQFIDSYLDVGTGKVERIVTLPPPQNHAYYWRRTAGDVGQVWREYASGKMKAVDIKPAPKQGFSTIW